MKNIVIIGGVAAGAKSASKIKRLLPDAKVSIYTDDMHVSYSSCGLPYYIEGNFDDYRTLLVRSVEEFKNLGIDVYLKSPVVKILPKQKEILVSHEHDAELIKYDKLIIASGARPAIPNIKGITDFDNIYTLRKIEDGIKIKERMQKSQNVVIIGGGYIGFELLEAFSKNVKHTVLIDHNKYILHSFDEEMSEIIRQRLDNIENKNFDMLTEEEVIEISGKYKYAEQIKTASGKIINCDMIVVCSGVRPNVEISKDAGIEIGETGAIKVNKLMQTSIEDIFACGDCTEKINMVSGKPVWIPLGSTANKEGRCAALNAAGIYCEFEGVLGSMVTRCLNTTAAMTGLTEKDAKKIGFSPVSAIVKKSDKVAFMPETGEITLKVVADKITGLILGAQAIGSVGADKRINSIASALIGHLTVSEFSGNDLTYSPPYSPTIDPLLNAMQILCSKTSRAC